MTPALLLLFLPLLQEPDSGRRAVRVSVVRPETATLHSVLVVPAFVEPFEKAHLVARVTGYIVDLPVEEGDALHRGDLVARLAAPELDARLARAQAELAQARAEVRSAESLWKSHQAAAEAARIEFEMIGKLHEQKAATDVELVRARSAHDVAVAEADAAEAAFQAEKTKVDTAGAMLQAAKVQASFREVRCPYETAIVTGRLAHPGQLARADETGLAELSVLDRLRIRVGIPEKTGPFLSRGVEFQLAVDALPGSSFPLKVEHTSQSLAESSRMLWVESWLENPGHHILPGMYCRASFRLDSRPDALTLPGGVILTGADRRPYVFVVRNGRSHKAPLRLGLDDGLRVEVLEGLSADSQVVSAGRERLRDGDPVKVGGTEQG